MRTRGQSPRFPWWRNRPYLLLSGIMFTNFLASGLIKPLFSIRAQELGAAFWEIGLIGTVSQVASAAVQYLWGRQSDRLMRRKPLVLIGMGGVTLATLLVGLTGSYRSLYAIQAISGFAYAAYSVGSLAMIGDILEGWPNRGRLMGLYRGGGSLAFGLAALFGGRLADLYGTGVPFLLASVFGSVAFLFAMWLAEAPARVLERATIESVVRENDITWGKVKHIMPFLIIVFVWFVAMRSAFEFWPVYMVGQGFTKAVITRLWGLAALGETVAMVLAGYLCDRWGSRRVVAVGLAGMGLIFVAYTMVPRLPWLIPIQMLRSIAFSAYSAGAMVYATEMGLRRQRGRMAGLYATASSLGGISGGAMGGALAEWIGVGPMIRSIGALMVLAGLVGGRKIVDPGVVVSGSPRTLVSPAISSEGHST